jgi:hypothetical protein
VKALRPSVKVGVILLGLVVAMVIAWFAVAIEHRMNPLPPEEASGGMAAFGDLVLYLAVFGVTALVPLALGLYWLRAVARFWSALTWGAGPFALTGLAALVAIIWVGHTTSSWILLAHARFGLMPLSALALLTCAIIARRPRHRWLLFAAAVVDGGIFGGYLLVNIVLPRLRGG